MSRGIRFISVGAGGFVVHAATLQGLVSLAGVPYPLATALAVEASILHNFLWHERWTWADRLVPAEGEKALSRASLGRSVRVGDDHRIEVGPGIVELGDTGEISGGIVPGIRQRGRRQGEQQGKGGDFSHAGQSRGRAPQGV